MMKLGKFTIIAALFVLTTAFNADKALETDKEASNIIGVWMPSEGTAYVKIFKEKDKEKYHGKIVWLKEPNDEAGNPRKNTDGKLILNMLNLKNFVFEDGEWVDGTIYDPKTGNTYYSSIKMVNENKLEVRGSLDPFGLIGRTDTWVRMKSE